MRLSGQGFPGFLAACSSFHICCLRFWLWGFVVLPLFQASELFLAQDGGSQRCSFWRQSEKCF